MKRTVQEKREKEKRIVSLMIGIYCHGRHKTPRGSFCPECEQLREYAHKRSDLCRFMETKTFCSKCSVHCYKPDMRDKIRTVMRYAGPRMIIYYPIEAVHHFFE